MSQSYRKPWATEGYGGSHRKFAKRQANKLIRRYKEEISNGRHYAKLFCSWDICDYKFWCGDDDKDFREKASRK